MAANRHALTLVESTTRYPFAILPGDNNVSIEQQEWEPGSPTIPWRIPLHPWWGGLNIDRFGQVRGYAKGPIDGSNDSILVPPPLVNSLTLTSNAVTGIKMVEFDSKLFIACGTRLYYVDSAYSVTLDETFGSTITDICVFNNELVAGFGATAAVLQTRNTAGTWTAAAAGLYAQHLCVVDEKLWRSHDTNQVDSCLTAPGTAASWTTAAYKVGDTSMATTCMIEYGGVLWVGKPDGMYQADPASRFHNQTPQTRRYPHSDNFKGSFTAWGYLWCPTVVGLLRVTPGEARIYGPELTNRPDFRFWVRGGAEWGGAIWLVCTDESAVSSNILVKMVPDKTGASGRPYVYHEMAQFSSDTRCIGISSKPTNPSVFWSHGNDARYVKLGRGAGRDIDDPNYGYATSWTMESGNVQISPDLSTVATLVGVTTVLDYDNSESLDVTGAFDDAAYPGTSFLTSQEGSGTAAITNLTNWQAVTRYAPSGTQGQFLRIKLTGTQSSGSSAGTDRPQIRECWAWGYLHPAITDVITVILSIDPKMRIAGVQPGRTINAAKLLFNRWRQTGTILTMELPNYADGQTVRVFVSGVKEIRTRSAPGAGLTPATVSQLQVSLTRISFSEPGGIGGYLTTV